MVPGIVSTSKLPNFTWWVWHCSAPRLSRKHPEKRSEFRFPPRRIWLYIDDDEDDEHEEEHKDDEDDGMMKWMKMMMIKDVEDNKG